MEAFMMLQTVHRDASRRVLGEDARELVAGCQALAGFSHVKGSKYGSKENIITWEQFKLS
jgi:hypothetical protein